MDGFQSRKNISFCFVGWNKSIYIFAPAFRAKRLVEGTKRDSVPAGEEGKRKKRVAGKNYLDFFWRDGSEVLTLASQK
jgi:hypothetical protein